MTIYLDQDGPLADFDQALLDNGIVNRTDFIHKPKDQWNVEDMELDAKVVKMMATPDFWTNLPVTKGAFDLVAEAMKYDKVFVLTARPSHTSTDTNWIAPIKFEWINKNFPQLSNTFICCLRHEKKDYAKPDSWLIDDMERNCLEWSDQGGKAILWKSAEQTIKELQERTYIVNGTTFTNG